MGLGETRASGIADSKYKQLLEKFCYKGKERNRVVLERKIESQLCFVVVEFRTKRKDTGSPGLTELCRQDLEQQLHCIPGSESPNKKHT